MSKLPLLMRLSASLLLLLLLGLSQAAPLPDDGEQEAEPELVDVTTGILRTNNATDDFLVEGDLLPPVTRNVIMCWSQNCLWEKGSDLKVTIHYTISSHYNSEEKQTIESSLRSFHSVSCIRFVPRNGEFDFLCIESRSGCFSGVGKQGSAQVLSLNKRGCIYRGIIQHEVLHALGFRHEHNRSDRNSYVRINWGSIQPATAYNFQKQNTNNLNAPYDYSSIMHYGKTPFSVDGRQKTITPIPNPNVSIGQRQGLSCLDMQKLRSLYNC